MSPAAYTPAPACAEVPDLRAVLRGVAIVPSAPLLLPEVSPGQRADLAAPVADLRRGVADALAALPATPACLLLASGRRTRLHRTAHASLAPLGVPDPDRDLPVHAALHDVLAATVRTTDAPLGLDLSVLARLVGSYDAPVVALTLAADAQPDRLAGTVAGVAAALVELDTPVTVIAAGDLAATRTTASPGYLHRGALDWDAAALAAVRTGDRDALHVLGPTAAADVGARGWAPTVAAVGLAAAGGLPPDVAALQAPAGVGYLIARFCP